MHINSNTIKLEDKEYSKLETLLKKMASASGIENVDKILIDMTKDSGFIKFCQKEAAFHKRWAHYVDIVEDNIKEADLQAAINEIKELSAGGVSDPDPQYVGDVVVSIILKRIKYTENSDFFDENENPIVEYDLREEEAIEHILQTLYYDIADEQNLYAEIKELIKDICLPEFIDKIQILLGGEYPVRSPFDFFNEEAVQLNWETFDGIDYITSADFNLSLPVKVYIRSIKNNE